MSASTERKNRIAAREAGTDKKTNAALETAEKNRKSKRRWTIGTIVVVVFLALVIFLNSGFLTTHSTAVVITDGTNRSSFSPAEMNYYYSSQYALFVSNYGSYASMFGLNTSTGITGLDQQPCPMLGDDATWKDYFMDSAVNQLEQYCALGDYADAHGLKLTEEEIANVESSLAGLEEAAAYYGYTRDAYITANYGSGVDYNMVRRLTLREDLASKAYNELAAAQEYTPEELAEKYESLNGEYDVFDFTIFFVKAEATEDGSISDEAMSAAKDMAYKILSTFKTTEGETAAERLNTAAAEAGYAGEEEAAERNAVSGGNLGQFKTWLTRDKLSEGDVNVIDSENGDGYYVVVFGSRDYNTYNTVNVRHILVKAVADENGEYSDEALAEAKAKAEEIYNEWKSGEATEESFAELANQYSEDGGSNTNGGLYESVTKSQTVEEFDAFCFAGHQSGDTGIVYGNNGSYAGYHIMYFVGENDERYCDSIAKSLLVNDYMSQWLSDLVAPYTAEIKLPAKFVG